MIHHKGLTLGSLNCFKVLKFLFNLYKPVLFWVTFKVSGDLLLVNEYLQTDLKDKLYFWMYLYIFVFFHFDIEF
jgi:hypothetical protein